MVISALVADLRPFVVDTSQPIRLGFRKKTQFVWDDRTFKDHQDRIRDQVSSMNLLISVLQLYVTPGQAIQDVAERKGRADAP